METTNPFENACKNRYTIDLPTTKTTATKTRYFDVENYSIGTVSPMTIWELTEDKLEAIYDLYTSRLNNLTTPKNSLFGNTPTENPDKTKYETILAMVEIVAEFRLKEKVDAEKRVKAEKRIKDLIYASENIEHENLLKMSAKEIRKEIKALKKSLGN